MYLSAYPKRPLDGGANANLPDLSIVPVIFSGLMNNSGACDEGEV
jgi:hypothetical protein